MSDKVDEVLKLLNDRLGDGGWVNIRLGSALLQAMHARGLLSYKNFRNPAHPLGIGDAELTFQVYRAKHPVFEDKDLPSLGFLVGAGGREP